MCNVCQKSEVHKEDEIPYELYGGWEQRALGTIERDISIT